MEIEAYCFKDIKKAIKTWLCNRQTQPKPIFSMCNALNNQPTTV